MSIRFLIIVLKKIIGGRNTLRKTNAGCGNFARPLEVSSGRYKVAHKWHTKVASEQQSVSDLRATSLSNVSFRLAPPDALGKA